MDNGGLAIPIREPAVRIPPSQATGLNKGQTHFFVPGRQQIPPAVRGVNDKKKRQMKLGGEYKRKLEPFGNKLTAKIDKPYFMMNQSVSVSLDATVPNQTGLELTTHNGTVKIDSITGKVSGTTHNGNVTASNVSGTIKLQTHNGSVTCEEIVGDVELRTHNGKASASYSKNAAPVCNVSIVTHNGGVDFTAPPNFSAAVEVSTHNGSIKTDIPITVIGTVTKRKLTGTIGTGQGKLYLVTHNGSIKIK